MEEAGLKAIGEDDISHILTVDSPFMKPEFVLDMQKIPTAPHASSIEFQRRLIQRDKENLARRRASAAEVTPAVLNCSRPASPFPKPPKVIKHEEDDSLYVKVEDLPEDVREQVHAMAVERQSVMEAGDSGENVNTNTADHPNPPRKSPLMSEPTRLSAQPTFEEIQMCFAQVDLAILMETKPRRKPNAGPTFRSASATTPTAGSGRLATGRRREKWVAAVRSQESSPLPPQQHQAESESESDSSFFSPNLEANQSLKQSPLNANLANAQPPSRMQQLLVDLANSRHNSDAAAIINGCETDKGDPAVTRSGGKPDFEPRTPSPSIWPPFAVSSDRSRRSSEQIQRQNFSFLRDDFVSKLEQIQALATAGPGDLDEADVHVSNGSKRAYQMPVWTHGGSVPSNGGAGGGRTRYQSSWSGRSQEGYEVTDPLVASRGAGHHGFTSRAGDGEASTDSESLPA